MATAESKPILIMRKYIHHIVRTFVRTFVRYIYLSAQYNSLASLWYNTL